MRKPALIVGMMVLATGFTAAWFVLSPEPATPGANDLSDASGAAAELQPLDALEGSSDANDPPSDGTPIESRQDHDTDKPADERVSGTEPLVGEPGPRVDTSRTPPQVPGESDAGGAPAPQNAGGAPAPRPFIKGHERPPGQNLGNVRPRARRLSQPAGVKKLDEVTARLRQDRRGLYAQYFGLSSPNLSELNDKTPALVRIDRQVYFPDREAFSDLPVSLDNFAAEWSGFLVIDEPGDYWLFWGADNGGRVELGGETVLLQDGMVRYVEVSTVLTLEAGLHPIRIEFAQLKNNVADWAKCAAALMWVPEGESKPVPVPPEMLMVPEWMWSDNAPIITSLSKTEGEIGDEITIYGQGLAGNSVVPTGSKDGATIDFIKADNVRVTFAGQAAKILESSDASLRVRVPIGARTGEVTVYRAKFIAVNEDGKVYDREIPSNSVEFTVTTQFGLMAEWHNLEGWSNYDFSVVDGRQPEVVQLESQTTFTSRDDFGVSFGNESLAAVWHGRLGVPSRESSGFIADAEGFIQTRDYCDMSAQPDYLPDAWVLRVSCAPQFQVSLGSLEPTLALAAGGYSQGLSGLPEGGLVGYDFVLWDSEERWLSLKVEWLAPSPRPAMIQFSWLRLSEIDDAPTDIVLDYWYSQQTLPIQYFVPPIVPPKPPVILIVKPVWAEGEQPPVPPYDIDGSRPSVAVGQEFEFQLNDYNTGEAGEDIPVVTVDGVTLDYEVLHVVEDGIGAGREMTCRATMPEGVGEGRMIARQNIVVSEPYFIDITNRGLVAYLYDIPEPSGLSELPDLGPLHCFKVRKDRQINFESAADFDLPFPAETFVIEWLGGLIIEEEGDYEFICRSDDGMKLWLDGNVVIDANHRQAPTENRATVHLVPGTYRFRMQYFENNQHEVCVLEWRATRGEGAMLETLIPREVIPARAFTLDVHPPFPSKTSTGKRTDGS